MNPFKWIKILKDYDKIKNDIDMTIPDTNEVICSPAKHLLLSRTFWINLAQLGLDLGGVVPQKWQIPLAVSSNIIMRLLTNQPVTLSMDTLKSGKIN